MPGDFVWRQNGTQATLIGGTWQARLDALQPAAGLHDVSCAGVPLAGSSFLGVDVDVSDRAIVSECYQRGGDFIVRYLQTAARPFAVAVYWRAGWFERAGQFYPRIDLVVSIETNLLDSRPRLSAVSNLRPATGTLIYCEDGYLLTHVGDASASPPQQLSGLQVSERQDDICYVEMCHPGDSISMVIETLICHTALDSQTVPGLGRDVRCLTRLFGQPLEKGVILRSRMRGLLVPRRQSDEIARAALAELIHSTPPLTA